MKEQLRIKNEGLRIGMVLMALFIILIAVVTAVKTYDLDGVQRVNLAERYNDPLIAEYDGCTYIRFSRTHEFIHKANCSNPEHKLEGK